MLIVTMALSCSVFEIPMTQVFGFKYVVATSGSHAALVTSSLISSTGFWILFYRNHSYKTHHSWPRGTGHRQTGRWTNSSTAESLWWCSIIIYCCNLITIKLYQLNCCNKPLFQWQMYCLVRRDKAETLQWYRHVEQCKGLASPSQTNIPCPTLLAVDDLPQEYHKQSTVLLLLLPHFHSLLIGAGVLFVTLTLGLWLIA